MQAIVSRTTGDGMSRRGHMTTATSPLTLYANQPTAELTLYDFEVVALDRLRVLKGIETARAKGAKPEEMDTVIKNLTRKFLGGELRTTEDHLKDQISHHILRLAYCQSEDKRKWFLMHEGLLFRWRLERQTPEQVEEFMRRSHVSLQQVSAEERGEAMERGLRDVWDVSRPAGVQIEDWRGRLAREPLFKVPFTQALELVAARRAFLRQGFAFVPREFLTHIILGRFRAALSKGLIQGAKALPGILRDERLGPVLGNMSKAYLGPQYGQGGKTASEQVRASEVAGLSASSFPLCMSALERALSDRSHLRHHGRMQYGLFLKGIGLGLEEAMVYWQGHFTRKMTGEEFVKRYAYNIRHNYGKEGKRADYTPYSCTKIILGTPPGSNEVHGCPYKHWDSAGVRKALVARGLSLTQVEAVMKEVSTKNYQIACRREFEARMGVEDDAVGQHPNGYYEACQRVLKGAQDTAAESAASAASSSSSSARKAAPTAGGPSPASSSSSSSSSSSGAAAAAGSTPTKAAFSAASAPVDA